MDPTQEKPVEDSQHEHTLPDKPAEDEVDDFKKIDTVAALAVDVENRGAVKGDDSDGRVDWTPKKVVATIFLSGLYVGKVS
jgi:hypothetical protein